MKSRLVRLVLPIVGCNKHYMGVSINVGTTKRMAYFMENPMKWMMTGGTPILGNLYRGMSQNGVLMSAPSRLFKLKNGTFGAPLL